MSLHILSKFTNLTGLHVGRFDCSNDVGGFAQVFFLLILKNVTPSLVVLLPWGCIYSQGLTGQFSKTFESIVELKFPILVKVLREVVTSISINDTRIFNRFGTLMRKVNAT